MAEVSQESLDEVSPGDNRPIVYRDQGRWVYRASAIGGCPRGVLAARRGYRALPPPGWLADAAEAGHQAEPFALGWLKARGWQISAEQQVVEWPIGTQAVVRGHIDGIGHYQRDRTNRETRLVEVKSMSENVFDAWRKDGFAAFPKYAAQLTVYMTVLKLPALYVIVRRATGDVVTQMIDSPPISPAGILRRILGMEQQVEGVEWPVCEAQYAGWCAWQYVHEAVDDGGNPVAEMAGMDMEQVAALAALYDDQKAVRDQAEQALTGLKKQLVQLVGDKAKLQAGLWSVSTRANTKTKLDEAALFEACRGVGIDPALYKSKVTYPDPILIVKKGGQ